MRLLRLATPILLVGALLVIGCSSGPSAPSGTAADIADKVFTEAGVEPFGEATSLSTDQEIEYFLGSTDYPAFTDSAVVQPMISIDTRILYVLQVATDKEATAVMEQLEVDVDPDRLICVQFSVDDVVIAERGNVVFMVIDSNHEERNALAAAFEKIE